VKISVHRILCLALLLGPVKSQTTDQAHATWREYGGSQDSSQYSSLTQINRSNVNKLQVSWVYPTVENKYFFNPIMVDGLLYVLAKNNSIIALDAATGKEIWVHPSDPGTTLITSRGINYWESKDRSDRRLLFASNHVLQAIDARTGKPILSFGNNGRVDLKEGLGRDPKTITLEQSTTPGRVFENLIVLGSATGQEYDSAPGDLRAFDVRTGKVAWVFHTIPHPGEFGYETWPKDAWKNVGGVNVWGEMTLDEKRGILYVPVASPKYNFYGGNRKGTNLFGDCLLALDARTGKRIWHFQTVHHDIWDYDNNTGPELLTVQHDGKSVEVVAQVTKQGFVFVFDRVTGKPLWPIEERPVPATDMPGEEVWPTQPFPVKPPPFARQKFTADDVSSFITDPAERARIRDEIQSARNEGLFTPPGLRNTVEMPGNVGGANWGSAAVNPTNGSLYVVSKDFPTMLKLEPETKVLLSGTPEQQGRALFEANCRACHGADRKGQPPGIPSLVNIAAGLKDEQVESIVKQGRGLMPGFQKLSAQDLHSLVSYLFTPDRASGPLPVAASIPTAGRVRYRSGYGYMTSSIGLSPISPPWTSLTAYDLNQGTIKWTMPLGEVPELAAKGIKNTGAYFPKGGPAVTAGGLIFTGTRDRKVRALDQETGKVLWEAQVESAIEGIPSVYEVGGREYVVFCAAARDAANLFGKPTAPTQTKGAYVAFALP
jgi:quinoprotein glucose dehydrogenase